jgi:CRP-like cAMP-binding protein
MVDTSQKLPQTTPCNRCPLKDLRVFRTFTDEELAFVSSFKTGELVAEAGTTILLESNTSAHLYTVLSGWAFRYKSLPDGRRQILNFAFPGDFIGLQSAMLKEMDHSVEALSDVVLCVFPRQKIWTLYNNHPGLAFDLTWIGSREERILDEHLLSVGRRSALERLAYLLLYVFYRAQALGMTSKRNSNELPVPFTQTHLADALGLSLVHTNKTLRRLYERDLLILKDGKLRILDEKQLVKLANYEQRHAGLRPLI